MHAHNIRNNSSGRFKLVSRFNIHPAKEKVLPTGFKIFEVVPRLKKKKKKTVMPCLRHSVFGYRLSICGWKYLLSKYAKHSLCWCTGWQRGSIKHCTLCNTNTEIL